MERFMQFILLSACAFLFAVVVVMFMLLFDRHQYKVTIHTQSCMYHIYPNQGRVYEENQDTELPIFDGTFTQMENFISSATANESEMCLLIPVNSYIQKPYTDNFPKTVVQWVDDEMKLDTIGYISKIITDGWQEFEFNKNYTK